MNLNKKFWIIKIANKICVILFFLLLIGCNKRTVWENSNSLIDYNSDSVYYKIDVLGDKEKESFLVTREISIQDSSFGGYAYENWQRAWNYSKTKDDNPSFLYKIHFYTDNKYKEFSKLLFRADGITYPVLKQGQFSNLYEISKKNLEHEGTQYLKNYGNIG